MPTLTSNFSWQMPLVNNATDANQWGTELNSNLSAQDTLIRALANSNIGNTAPTSPTPQAGTWWINNTSSPWLVQIYDGSNWVVVGTLNPTTHSFTAGGGLIAVQEFKNAGSFTYTPTAGMTYCIVEIVGGGGGGGCVISSGIAGDKGAAAGGAAGSYAKAVFIASDIGVSQAITVGAGGAGASTLTPGATGGTTQFGTAGLTLITAPGGTGGGSCHSGFNSGFILTQGGFHGGNASGTFSGGRGTFLTPAGGTGLVGITLNNTIAISGSGGMSFFGAGGDGYATVGVGPAEGAGNNGPSIGSGGGGALMNTSIGTFNGGNGAAGGVIITEFGV